MPIRAAPAPAATKRTVAKAEMRMAAIRNFTPCSLNTGRPERRGAKSGASGEPWRTFSQACGSHSLELDGQRLRALATQRVRAPWLEANDGRGRRRGETWA